MTHEKKTLPEYFKEVVEGNTVLPSSAGQLHIFPG